MFSPRVKQFLQVFMARSTKGQREPNVKDGELDFTSREESACFGRCIWLSSFNLCNDIPIRK
jgi:hypothetical protein